jgi:hypothetical protein
MIGQMRTWSRSAVAANYPLTLLQKIEPMSKELLIKEKNEKLKQFIFQKYQDGELDNSTLLQHIEVCGAYLNLKTISDYAKANGITYNGVLERIKTGKIHYVELFGTKFVGENL